MAQPLRINDYFRESQTFLARAVAAFVLVGLLVGAIVARMAFLQVHEYEHFATLARGNQVKVEPLAPTRGLIYDRNGVLLADNLPSYDLELVPERIADLDATIARLRELLTIDENDLERFEKLRRQSRPYAGVPLRIRLSPDEVASFAVNRHRFTGVEVNARLTRHYPLGADLVHAVGYVGRINAEEVERIDRASYNGTSHIGKIGIELKYEDRLHGSVGLQRVETNAFGRVLRLLDGREALSGEPLELALDVRLQREALLALGNRNGAVVAIDPNNGEVLALVSKPGFDPNAFVNGIGHAAYAQLERSPDKPLFNRALHGQYPPGSTIKPLLGLASLSSGLVPAGSRSFCPGHYQLPNQDHKYRDWKKGGHGWMTLDDAIVQSCDVYFYELSRVLGIDRMHDFLAGFGFGRPTGIDALGERDGLLPSRQWKQAARGEVWFPGETLITGIGQGFFLATPLQLASATATIAARGRHFRPSLLRLDDGVEPDSIVEAAPEHWSRVIGAMREVVHGLRGTAHGVQTDRYSIAGKTGTAQVYTVGQDEEYDKENVDERLRDHALFVGFAPVESPRIAVAVVVENGGGGGTVAAPVARRVMDRYLLP
ncbi:MAG: penicillin-binding protein 2 [Chromatiales bacterium]|nr:penicillin-binding protein 2 [Chromatiales bacterium]